MDAPSAFMLGIIFGGLAMLAGFAIIEKISGKGGVKPMIDREKVIEMLMNYRSYRFAVANGIAPFVEEDTLGMPMAFSFGSRPPSGFGGRGTEYSSEQDFKRYKRTVELIDGAVNEVLSDDQRIVIKRKYLDQNRCSLFEIAKQKDRDDSTIRRWHREALKELTKALAFVEAPEIVNIDFHLDKIS